MTVQQEPSTSWKNKLLRSRKHFFGLLRYTSATDKLCLSFGLIFAAGAGIINPINILAFRDIVNNFTSDKFEYEETRKSVGRFMVLAFIMLLVAFIQALLLSTQAKCLRRRYHYLCFMSLQKKKSTWYDRQLSPDIGAEIAQRVALIEQGIGVKLGEFMQNLCGLLTGVIMAFVEGWKLSLVASALLPFVLLFCGIFGFVVSHIGQKERSSYEQAKCTSEDAISHIKTVFAYGAEEAEVRRYAHQLDKPERVGVQKSLIVSLFLGSTGFAFYTAAGLIFWYGVTLMIQDDYHGGAVVTVFINILLGGVCLGNALPNLPYVKAAAAAAEELQELIESNDQTEESSLCTQVFMPSCTIRWNDVTFSYPSYPGKNVLRQVNFFLKPNSKLAIVGLEGAGKSAVFQLLLRHYEPDSGEFLVSGVDVRCWNIKKFRERLGFVAEAPVLFDGTIAHNIRLGRLEATDDEIRSASMIAQVHEFIQSLSGGYDTSVAQLSGLKYVVQRWLITLARAVIRNPTLLLLDCPNLPLNRSWEYSILIKAVKRVSTGRTVLIASRYPSIVEDADQILVLDKGFVRQMGTAAELLAEETGLYATMTRVYNILDRAPRGLMCESIVNDIDVQAKEKGKKPLRNTYFSRTLRENRPELLHIIFGCISSVVAGAAQPSFAVLYSEVFDIFASRSGSRAMQHRIAVVGGMMTLVGVCRLLACVGQGYFFGVSSERLIKRLRIEYFEAIMRQEVAWFESPGHSHALTSHLTDTVTQLRGLSGLRIGNFVEVSSLIIVSVVISFACSWELTLVTAALAPFVILGSLIQLQNLRPKYSTLPPVLPLVNEILSKMHTVRSLNLEEHYVKLYIQKLDELACSDVKESILLATVYSLTQSAGIFTLAAVFELGAYLFVERSLSVIRLFRAFAVMNMGTQSFGRFFDIVPEIQVAYKSAEIIYRTIDRKPKILKDNGLITHVPEFSGRITFSHVTIKPRDDVDRECDVLKDFSCTINPGQVVGFVGLPGCGRLGIVDLVEGFIHPSSSEDDGHGIYFDYQNIRQLEPSWIRSQCALISYESRLFSRSIKENIAYGIDVNEAALNDIIQAARSANVHDLINALPEGYDTVFVNGDSQISEGQQRRIALARALFRKPKILLVDRFTTDLDVEDQRLILRALTDNMHQYTSIVIPHKFAHASYFDHTIVLRSGQQVESGTFAQLSQSASYFKDLVNLEKRNRL